MTVKQALKLILSGTIAFAATLLLHGVAQAASITDPAGDFLFTYTGVQAGDLDVLSSEVTLNGTQLFFSATLAAAVGTTPSAFYVFGLDRGQGTQRFVTGTPSVGAGVVFDSVVILRPDGTGNFNDLLNSANSITLNPASISISGSQISAIFDVSLFPSTGFAAVDYTWNLWPRLGSISGNAAISDFAPDASNASVAVPEPSGIAGLLAIGFGGLMMVGRTRRILNVSKS
ncbi:MAG: PEP-CTERM sorting domain-containing protein [Anaerolineae bacterium]|nr:PEP-CTERM sorting domain-containing protein [Gloeobacterales cyanobacterium ES-bin-313]